VSYEALAFFTGLFGGLHCVAMCGPLVMALPFGGNGWLALLQRMLYQLGRIITYSVFGLAAGLIGQGLNIIGLQRMLSLITGVLLIAIAFSHFSGKKSSRFSRFQQRAVAPIALMLGKWLAKPYGGFFAGALHGLLPCGMVYMAMAASLNSGSALAGGKFMLFFGLGTTPLLLFASFLPLFFRKFRIPALAISVLYLFAGTFLLTRGMNLDIPYISMPIENGGAPVCN
jgi:sulfite exporter TauE/SafE